MQSVLRTIRSLGGVARRSELLAHGHTDGGISAGLNSGDLLRPRNGWFVERGTPAALVEAVRVGGRLGCRSALRQHGVWALDDGRLHVEVAAHESRLRSRASRTVRRSESADESLVVHWSNRFRIVPAGRQRLLAPVIDALECFSRCAPSEHLHCALESALNLRLIERATGQALAPAGMILDARSESGLETLTRTRLQASGIQCVPQVVIGGVGRIDLVIGDRLAIELDGSEWHDDPAQIARDRARDAALTALGFHVLRFGFAQVIRDWEGVEAAILAVVDRGWHLRTTRFDENAGVRA